ncbi:hypothetical protein HDU96_006484 [Phlyctochytrium bullatum]|nr:hypothetical protein HDU96_006484 [Phlyctochytrium bullatum]
MFSVSGSSATAADLIDLLLSETGVDTSLAVTAPAPVDDMAMWMGLQGDAFGLGVVEPVLTTVPVEGFQCGAVVEPVLPQAFGFTAAIPLTAPPLPAAAAPIPLPAAAVASPNPSPFPPNGCLASIAAPTHPKPPFHLPLPPVPLSHTLIPMITPPLDPIATAPAAPPSFQPDYFSAGMSISADRRTSVNTFIDVVGAPPTFPLGFLGPDPAPPASDLAPPAFPASAPAVSPFRPTPAPKRKPDRDFRILDPRAAAPTRRRSTSTSSSLSSTSSSSKPPISHLKLDRKTKRPAASQPAPPPPPPPPAAPVAGAPRRPTVRSGLVLRVKPVGRPPRETEGRKGGKGKGRSVPAKAGFVNVVFDVPCEEGETIYREVLVG